MSILLWSDHVSPYAFVAGDPHPWRQVRCSYMDARRFANKQGLTLKGPPEDGDAVAVLLIEAGAPAGFAAFLAGEGGAAHDRLRNEADASGVFGVPTFVFEGELFWGGDRIGLLRERPDEKG
ncbi:MAG: hypothetical protein GEV13_32505 [Rhodospirillales bacterium]|nr:hypothetical protein [Rhodospirillales bacterium]